MRGKTVLALFGAAMLAVACWPQRMAAETVGKPEPVAFVLSVKTSPSSEFETRMELIGFSLAKQWLKATPDTGAATGPPLSDVWLTVNRGGEPQTYVMDETGEWYAAASGQKMKLPETLKDALLRYANVLRERHYGELVDWKEARRLFPRKSKFTIVDMETGLKFRVQRRAGSRHADVQPLTVQDTAVMKQIYGGAWSWKRRAILAVADGRRVAASMHGMPHGGDGIPGNGFSGHFCVHFLGSTTHTSKRVDLAHQLMVHKAGGTVASYVRTLSPADLARGFFESLDQRDEWLLRQFSVGLPPQKLEPFLRLIDSLESVRATVSENDEDAQSALAVEIRAKAKTVRKGAGTVVESCTFTVARDSVASPWKIVDVRSE
jgi:hypothetical protein